MKRAVPDELGPEAAAWWALGEHRQLLGEDIFVVDLPAQEQVGNPALLVIHGFPTSSMDFALVAHRLAARRRVVLLDLPGYGFSAKPDRAYTVAGQADVVANLSEALGLDRIDLLTHDMGDTVGGELLARHADGDWPVDIRSRVVTNGSIYLDLAHLTAAQLALLGMPDRVRPELMGGDAVSVAAGMAGTLAPAHRDAVDLLPHAQAVILNSGRSMMPRTIRYIEERRVNERRFTGAIETHPSPLHVVWGPEDPIAVRSMPEQLRAVRPDATLRWIDGAGHYPQLEDPDAYVAAVLAAIDG